MKQKTRILIYILIAAAFVILGSIAIISNHSADIPVSAQEHIDLGRIYLVDLSYEKASLEFTEAIEIEPLNADAYLGLAEAYVGMGDTEKAVEVLEEGYDKTGDERLKERLDEIKPPVTETTTVTTTFTTEEAMTVSTAALVVIPNLAGLSEKEAIEACENAGLNYSISYGYSDSVAKGYVMAQTIPENANVAEGISVPFTVSEGAKVVTTVTTTAATTVVPAEEFITIRGKQYSILLSELDLSNELNLTNDDIKDLGRMVNLVKLNLSTTSLLDSNSFNSIDILSNLKNLEELYISSTELSDISILRCLTNLTHLSLSCPKIQDVNILSNLKKMEYLHIIGDAANVYYLDINVLNSLTKINELSIQFFNLSDLKPIGNLKNLKKLILWKFTADDLDLSPLSNLTNLEYLTIGATWINDISPLGKLTNLKELSLYNNDISDISALKNLKQLTSLSLSCNNIKDISSLKKLTNLNELSLNNNYIVDIIPLNNLSNLTKLQLGNIGNMSLNLGSNQISDVSALMNLENLKELNLSGNLVNKDDIEELKKELPDCKIEY